MFVLLALCAKKRAKYGFYTADRSERCGGEVMDASQGLNETVFVPKFEISYSREEDSSAAVNNRIDRAQSRIRLIKRNIVI